MRSSKSGLRNQDKYILGAFLTLICIVIGIILFIPEQWIIQATSTAISLMVYAFGGLLFNFLFFVDVSGKRRIRTGRHSSRWLKDYSYYVAAAFVAIALLLYSMFGHSTVVSLVTDIVLTQSRTDALLMMFLSSLSAFGLILYSIWTFTK